MGRDDVVLEWLKDNEAPDEVIEAFEGSALRKEIRELAKWKAEIGEPAVAEVTSLKKAPVREKAFKEIARVDFDSLRPAEKRLIETFDWDGEQPDQEAITKFVSDFDLPTLPGEAPSTEAQPAAASIANEAQQTRIVAPAKTTPREQIAELEQLAAEARDKGDTAAMQRHQQAAMSLKNQALKPEGLQAQPA